MLNKKESSTLVSLQIRRVIPAPPDSVFAVWVDPDELQKWWGPKGVRCLSAELDLRVGGQYKIANQLPDNTVLWIVGEFEAVERPHLLIYTWAVSDKSANEIAADSESAERVLVRFNRHEQGTEIVLTHERIATASLRDQHQTGWCGCLDGLVGFLASAPEIRQ